ncbi:hypothetical protein [Sphingomonas quercus]|nr:hypothetical protein [Sphingomonas quercus]
MAEPAREAPRRRADYDTEIATVTPLRHGYYRLQLADGTAYNTTVVAAPPAVGDAVHVRRSPLGTTFFDMAGRSPFAVKPARAR